MSLQEVLQDALDNLASTRTSLVQKGNAFNTLEKLVGEICVKDDEESKYKLEFFVALQDTFQCNVASRLISWLRESTLRLDSLTSRGTLDQEKETEVNMLSSQAIQALSIVQGVSLTHTASKSWLGRRSSLEVFLDLFMVARHVLPTSSSKENKQPSESTDTRSRSRSGPPPVSLASAVLDTLLCILVDSCPALRVFEEANGVQHVVKILKRAGTPREVRMKCLEFLYFYLLDETSVPNSMLPTSTTPTTIPTAPNSPTKPTQRSATSSTDSSISSTSSLASDMTTASYTTYATSFSSGSFDGASTPVEPGSPPSRVPSGASLNALKPSPRIITPPQSRSLLMLKKEVDYTPMSPKKAQISRLGVGTPRGPSSQRNATSSIFPSTPNSGHKRAESQSQAFQTPGRKVSRGNSAPQSSTTSPNPALALSPEKSTTVDYLQTPAFHKGHRRGQSSIDIAALPLQAPVFSVPSRPSGARTMEEKKEILGSMLGNVDALVEGVRKAGIWGLG
ncbi:CDC14-domain-containing protein [Panus rudis PR-1116 ss-1]|nr:CDC14-domain-containing protein [Panus rudis PR-1116 ss-1]